MKHKLGNKECDEETNKPKKVFDKVRGIHIQFILVVATWTLVVISIWQTCTVKQSMERSTKAYLSIVNKPIPLHDISTNTTYQVNIEITNTGQSPAYKVLGVGKFVLESSENSAWQIADSMLVKQASVLGANEKISFEDTISFNGKQTEQITNQKSVIFFVGRITYDDVLGENDRFLDFCFSYDTREWKVNYCKNHNNAN